MIAMPARTNTTLRLTLDRIPSPVGDLLLSVDDEGYVRTLDFEEFEPRLRTLLRRQYEHDVEVRTGRAPADIRSRLDAYFGGELTAVDALPVRTGGTAFQRSVWAALRTIPAGTTVSYGALGAMIGMPKGARAIGMANGSNPVAIIQPCHRVIGANGTLTGFGGGMHRKRWLLAHEGVAIRP